MKVLIPLSIVLLFTACSSVDEEEDPSNAHYAAYAADGLTFHTPAPERDPRPLFFYHKFCTLADEPGHFSPTSYGCDDQNK